MLWVNLKWHVNIGKKKKKKFLSSINLAGNFSLAHLVNNLFLRDKVF